MGKAIVASPQSLTGLAGHGSVPALVASGRAEWVDAVVRLMDDRDERRRLGESGRLFVETIHHWHGVLEPLESILQLPGERSLQPAVRPGSDEIV